MLKYLISAEFSLIDWLILLPNSITNDQRTPIKLYLNDSTHFKLFYCNDLWLWRHLVFHSLNVKSLFVRIILHSPTCQELRIGTRTLMLIIINCNLTFSKDSFVSSFSDDKIQITKKKDTRKLLEFIDSYPECINGRTLFAWLVDTQIVEFKQKNVQIFCYLTWYFGCYFLQFKNNVSISYTLVQNKTKQNETISLNEQ